MNTLWRARRLRWERYRKYRCDVCSERIGKRGRVLFAYGRMTDAFCHAHRNAKSFGRFDRA